MVTFQNDWRHLPSYFIFFNLVRLIRKERRASSRSTILDHNFIEHRRTSSLRSDEKILNCSHVALVWCFLSLWIILLEYFDRAILITLCGQRHDSLLSEKSYGVLVSVTAVIEAEMILKIDQFSTPTTNPNPPPDEVQVAWGISRRWLTKTIPKTVNK